MKTLMVVALILGAVGAHSEPTLESLNRQRRERRLHPLLEAGVITETGRQKALEYPEKAFEGFAKLGEAMNQKLRDMGLSHVDETIGYPKAQGALREAAREALREHLKLDRSQASDQRINDIMARLRESCGSLAIPEVGPSSSLRHPVFTTPSVAT